MLALDENGLLCARGGFHVDPVRPVPRAVFTGEHRRIEGCAEAILPGPGAIRLGDVTVTFHPSGYAPFARQVRITDGRETWVATGDWKRLADPLAPPFERLACDGLALPAPFALPIFRWESLDALKAWLEAHETCALHAAPVLALRLQAQLGVPLRRHAALDALARRYAELGVAVPPSDESSKRVLAATTERVKVRGAKTALADGAARIRGPRRRSNFDTGFALSEHADWDETLRTVAESGARRVLVTGLHAEPLARFLREERGLEASSR